MAHIAHDPRQTSPSILSSDLDLILDRAQIAPTLAPESLERLGKLGPDEVDGRAPGRLLLS
jgi:hypothetical protein